MCLEGRSGKGGRGTVGNLTRAISRDQFCGSYEVFHLIRGNGQALKGAKHGCGVTSSAGGTLAAQTTRNGHDVEGLNTT